jgi:RimJ/RimL family protein N-acetyltransferase
MYPEVPVLETDRLVLRAHRPADFADCAAMWGDPAVTRFIGGRPFSGEEVWARMLRYAGHWQWMGYGFWAVEEKASGDFIGDLGFANLKRDLDPSLSGAPELGWALATRAQGKGYATEALLAVIAWGDVRFEGARTVCMIHPDNAPSMRVAQKCGYREFWRTEYRGNPAVLMERMKR